MIEVIEELVARIMGRSTYFLEDFHLGKGENEPDFVSSDIHVMTIGTTEGKVKYEVKKLVSEETGAHLDN